jgi:lipid A ethanolaminephosphotransferase
MRNRLPAGSPSLSVNTLILGVSAFLIVAGNATFISRVLDSYPLNGSTLLPLASLGLVFGGITVLLLAPLCFGRLTRPLLIAVLLLSSAAAYFMDTYGIVISDDMLRNAALTSNAEAFELLTAKLIAYVVLLGILPSVAVAKIRLRTAGVRSEIFARLRLFGGTLLLVVATMMAFGSFYASFLRGHKELRQHANPVYYLYSAAKFASQSMASGIAEPMLQVGTDAAIPAGDTTRDLVIMVVGETARADRFSLNGYPRETNPGLKQHNVISLTDFQACGTSTAVSVPCMFLSDGEIKGAQTIRREENVLDVLRHGGVNVLWLDNNSDSKGVAERVDYRDFKSPANNPVCDTECRDEGMLAVLQEYIDSHPRGDILIVLHQMGSHGPAYHRRYPPAFEKFRPACKESDLSLCTREEIGNAYDNTILYTDHFLSGAIKVLQRNDARFDTALFYVSDHGESLGENGVYLHGLPKAIAPEAQLRVPAILWFGPRFHQADPQALRLNSTLRFSHDNVFHTLLGLFEIESAAYKPGKDLLRTGTTAPALTAQGTGRR